MTFKELKEIIREILNEGRIYGASGETPHSISTEYELTPEEKLALKGMTIRQRQSFAQRKLHQARKAKGICIQCGQKPSSLKSNGQLGSYCEDCLQMFRAAREKLSKKRGSCTRCPNPPLPGKKLCQKCTDELEMQRLKALDAGLCLRCKKKPAENNTLFCTDCMREKVAANKKIKQRKKQEWSDYEIEETQNKN